MPVERRLVAPSPDKKHAILILLRQQPVELLAAVHGARALRVSVDRNLNAVEIGWPFRLGLEGCIVDRSQDIGW